MKKPTLKNQLKELNDKYLRLHADFENARKKSAEEKLNLIRYSEQEIITDLLPILDNFERAVKTIKDSNKENEGFILIYNSIKNILEKRGLKKIECLGQKFNIDFHEAITQAPVKNKKEKNLIIDVIENGYLLKDKVIRFAKVVIGK
tara:strand:- start:292 stop:732 length:441 start_codon:yes stop_codon:yes gene_type:complete